MQGHFSKKANFLVGVQGAAYRMDLNEIINLKLLSKCLLLGSRTLIMAINGENVYLSQPVKLRSLLNLFCQKITPSKSPCHFFTLYPIGIMIDY